MKNKIIHFLLLLIILVLVVIILKCNYTKIIISYIYLLMIITFGSYNISKIIKERIGFCIPIFFMITFVYIYITSLLDILRVSYHVFCVIIFLMSFYFLIINFQKSKIKSELKELLNPEYVYFVILFIVCSVTTFNSAFYIWDEFTFWGIAPKNMYYLDTIYTNNLSTTLCFYPPNPTILIYFISKTLGIYSQGIELFSMLIISYSLLLTLFDKSNCKNNVSNFSG